MGAQDLSTDLAPRHNEISDLFNHLVGLIIGIDMNYFIREKLSGFVVTIILTQSWTCLIN